MSQEIIKLEGFYTEETLIELFQEGKITRCQMIWHHSQERRQEFIDFCKEKGLQEDETAAELFTEEQIKAEQTGEI